MNGTECGTSNRRCLWPVDAAFGMTEDILKRSGGAGVATAVDSATKSTHMPHLSSGDIADIPFVIDGIAPPITPVVERSMAEVAHRNEPHTMAVHKNGATAGLQQRAKGLPEMGSVFETGEDLMRSMAFVT